MPPNTQPLLLNELSRLKELAKQACSHAYCPYSKFPVGAVVVTDRGNAFSACNVENASFGLSQCAERNAVARMIAQGEKRISGVAIYTPTSQPTTPCGACRQVINEFNPEARIIAFCDSDSPMDTTLTSLLPRAFGPDNID